MLTAAALAEMTDRGRFERLATSVLRKDNKDYQTIVHTGVNAQGETVTSPLDGFCLVPASRPARFLLVEHTTTDKSKLERKWLHDTSSQGTSKASESDDGDLVKAGREARQLRIDHPDAAFTVVLTTNQRPSTDLLKKVYKKAKELGVTCDVWDQSRLADLLDSTPEGQWLRKEHLGIETEMLSPSLLRELCERSLMLYEKEMFLTKVDDWVPREVDERIAEGLLYKSLSTKTVVPLGCEAGEAVTSPAP